MSCRRSRSRKCTMVRVASFDTSVGMRLSQRAEGVKPGSASAASSVVALSIDHNPPEVHCADCVERIGACCPSPGLCDLGAYVPTLCVVLFHCTLCRLVKCINKHVLVLDAIQRDILTIIPPMDGWEGQKHNQNKLRVYTIHCGLVSDPFYVIIIIQVASFLTGIVHGFANSYVCWALGLHPCWVARCWASHFPLPACSPWFVLCSARCSVRMRLSQRADGETLKYLGRKSGPSLSAEP